MQYGDMRTYVQSNYHIERPIYVKLYSTSIKVNSDTQLKISSKHIKQVTIFMFIQK